MSAQKRGKKKSNNNNQEWVTIKSNSNSPKKRKRRRKKNNQNPTTHQKSTKPKHAAPPNAATIYCQWFQEGLCQRGNDCFFIHGLDPLSEKNPIEHRQMIKALLKTDTDRNTNVSIPLNKTQKPYTLVESWGNKPEKNEVRHNNDDGFILPSQNQAFQQQIRTQNNNAIPQTYHRPIPTNPSLYAYNAPPNPYSNPYVYENPYTNTNAQPQQYHNGMNANAMEFTPNIPTNNGHTYNPYLTVDNMRSVNPYQISADFSHNQQTHTYTNDTDSHLNFNIPETECLNEEDYEVWEDENGEIIVVEKDQLYGDDPIYHNQKILKEFNQERGMDRTRTNMQSQKGIRAGNVYSYGSGISPEKSENNLKNKNKKKRIRRRKKGKKGYSNAAAKYGNIYPSQGKVESFDAVENETKAVICRFWLRNTCAYGGQCNNAHRFEDSHCPHCMANIGKSAIAQQQHLRQCRTLLAMNGERKVSEGIECGICKENVVEKKRKFGLLTGCAHAFCLQCIREWRGVLHQSREAVRACPICRQITYFIVPCDRFVSDAKRKAEIIESYKQRLSEIKCKHFAENEECPFGSSCFYKHVRKDGSIDEKKVSLRHMINADGETEIMKQLKLSDLLFGTN